MSDLPGSARGSRVAAAPSPSPSRGRRRWSTSLLLLVALGVLLLSSPGALPSSASHPPVAELKPSGGTGGSLIGQAEASLSYGAGPAAHRPMACLPTVGGATCQPSAIVPAVRQAPATLLGWRNISASVGTGPGLREGYAMTFDSADGYVVLFGGTNSSAATNSNYGLSDTWTFSGGVWTHLSISGPAARGEAMMTYDAKDGYVLLFGGTPGWWGVNDEFNDTWAFHAGTWTNLSPANAPSPRRSAAMTYDVKDGYVLLFGGLNTRTGIYDDLSDTWTFAGGLWTNVTAGLQRAPAGRDGAAFVYDPAAGCALLFGGYEWPYYTNGFSGQLLNDTWCFAGGRWGVLQPAHSAPASAWTSMTYDPTHREMVLFGTGAARGNETWTFSQGTWHQTHPFGTNPTKRFQYTFVWDPTDAYDLLYGGSTVGNGGGTPLNDTLVLAANLSADLVVLPTIAYRGTTVVIRTIASTFGATVANTSLRGLPLGCGPVNASGTVCTPTVDGTYPLAFFVNDTQGEFVVSSSSLRVGERPAIAAFALHPSTLTLGGVAQFNVTLLPGHFPVTYSYAGLPSGCASTNVGGWSCTPRVSGTFPLNVTVTDILGVSVFALATLTINPSLVATALAASATVLDVGQSVTLTTQWTGGTAPFAYNYSGLPGGCATSNSPTLACAPTSTGPYSVQVAVEDADGAIATAAVMLEVFPAPRIYSLGASPAVIDLGQSVTFELNASVVAPVVYSGLPASCTTANVTALPCTPDAAGTYTVHVLITDAQNVSVGAVATLEVNPTLVLSSFGTGLPGLDVGSIFPLETVVAGGTLPYTFSYTGLPNGCLASAT